MKITYDWLKDHLKTNQTEGKLLEQLTNVGLEVEGIESFQYLLPPNPHWLVVLTTFPQFDLFLNDPLTNHKLFSST